MKRLLFSCFILFFSLINSVGFAQEAWHVPAYQNYVTDNANIIDEQPEAELNALLKELQDKTQAQVAVLTMTSLEGKPVEEAALQIGRKWGLGGKENKGLLILLSLQERKLRTEVGYGLEGVLPDGKVGGIQRQQMIPFFKKADFSSGLTAGSLAFAQAIAQEAQVTLSPQPVLAQFQQTQDAAHQKKPSWLHLTVLLLMIFLIIKNPGGFMSGLILGGLLGSSRSSGGDFGRGSGFGGFGGGDFGGGGPSSDW
jgi:uncharacterized protein